MNFGQAKVAVRTEDVVRKSTEAQAARRELYDYLTIPHPQRPPASPVG